MQIKKHNESFAYIDELIRRRATGPPQLLGKKIGVTGWQAKRIIRSLKEDGLPIEYCRSTQSYYYTDNVKVSFSITVGDLNILKILGGQGTNRPFCHTPEKHSLLY